MDFISNFSFVISLVFKLLNSKVITPTNEEIKLNPASRSAKLRVAKLII